MITFAAYGVWELWFGFHIGRMAPIVAGGSYLCAERAGNPAGFWIAAAFNVMIVGGAMFVAFLP